MPDGGVGGRYCIEPVDFLGLVIERAAHDQSHHHFDTLGLSLAHVFDVRDAGELLGVLGEIIKESLVEVAVDETGEALMAVLTSVLPS